MQWMVTQNLHHGRLFWNCNLPLHFGCHIGINFAVFMPLNTKAHHTRPFHFIFCKYSIQPYCCIASTIVLRKEAFILSSTANTFKLNLRLFLDFFSYEYFIFSPLLNPLRLNHGKLKFHGRFSVGVGRTRLGWVIRQDTENVWKYRGWSNVAVETDNWNCHNL